MAQRKTLGAAPRRDRGTEWLLSGLMLAGIGSAAGALTSVLNDFQWWWVVMLLAAIVFAAAAVVRHLARNRWWATLAAAVAAVVGLTVFFAPGTALIGLIPTADTLEAFRDLEASGRDSIASQTTPADATTGIVYLLCVGIAIIAFAMDLFAHSLKLVAAAGIPLLALLLAPSFVRTELNDPFLFALTAVAYLGMLLVTSRPVGRRTAVGIGAAALVASLLVPIVLPRVDPGAAAEGTAGGVTTGVNPIITLGQDLRQGTATLALTYTSTEPGGLYLRLTALDDFTGTQWAPTSTEVIPENDVAAIGPVPGLAEGVATRAATTQIAVAGILSRWLPLPYAPASITGLEGSWGWEPDALAVRTERANARGQEYTVESVQVTPSVEQLVAAGTTVAPGMERYLAVPDELPPVVATTAAEVAGQAASNYDKAVALQDFFRSGDFIYSEEAPVEEGFDGSGASVLGPFLESKTGYCVHFSSAMASMARTLGIPARVAVGFTPGDATTVGESGPVEYRVSTHNLHAWPELFFEGVGWVRFEPTPGRGTVPEFAPLSEDDPTTPDVDESVPPAQPTPAPTSTSTAAPNLPDEPTDPTSAPDSAVQSINPAWIVSAVALLLLLTPWGVRTIRRSRRMTAVDDGSAVAAWEELRDTADDLGLRPSDSWTPRYLALELAPALDDKSAAALARLRTAVERESYAEQTVTPSVRDVRTVSRSLRRHAGLAWRLAAAFVPRSVLARWMPRRAQLDETYR